MSGARTPVWIEVVRGGALTTVQDLGRSGFRSCGVPAGGAADPWCARAANRLVGNPDGAALLEMTLAGPVLRLHSGVAVQVALVGIVSEARFAGGELGDLGELRVAETASWAQGSVLELGRARARAWLAVAGGFEVALSLGSRATDLAGGFGGADGRALRAGDRLPVSGSEGPIAGRRLADGFLAELAQPLLRILPGPDGDAATLAAAPFRVAARSDRRGVRLEGRTLGAGEAELRSQGVLPGTVQLPPSGEPIVLGVDAPVTGGYPWIAQTIAADVGRLAHLAPGDRVGFELVDLDAAERALSARERSLAEAVVAA